MPQVICKLPHASTCISGVKFESKGVHMLSEEISDEQAAHFLSITGYEAYEEVDQEIVRLSARATELGIEVDKRWKAQRLTAEIDKALAAAKVPVKTEAVGDPAATGKTE
jgi:hypothetical protein